MADGVNLSNAEWVIMNAVWRICPEGGDVTVSEVMAEIKGRKKWHVSTLKTTLERLVTKGALSSRVRGRTCFYTPTVDRTRATRTSLADFFDTVLDGAVGPLVSYLSETKGLSRKQVADLEKLLNPEQKR
jgi:predicted transcriptional regulator